MGMEMGMEKGSEREGDWRIGGLTEDNCGHSPKRGGVDRVYWRFDPQDGFTDKALRGLIEEKDNLGGGNGATTIWLKSIPKKICIFLWRAKLGRLPSRSVLDKMRVDLDSTICPRCEREMETIEHAL